MSERGREELARLRRENHELQMDREILRAPRPLREREACLASSRQCRNIVDQRPRRVASSPASPLREVGGPPERGWTPDPVTGPTQDRPDCRGSPPGLRHLDAGDPVNEIARANYASARELSPLRVAPSGPAETKRK